MSYMLQITNNFVQDVSAIGVTVKPGQTEKIGYTEPNTLLHIPLRYGACFLDIGEQKISGFSDKKNGILISYGGEECEFRYDDGYDGLIKVTVNAFGQLELDGEGDFCLVGVPNFVLPKPGE